MKKNWPLLLIAVIGIALGALWGERQRSPDPMPLSANTAPTLTRLPNFSLPTPDGSPVSSEIWDGKIRVVNFWATWCPPCREEMPMLVRLQDEFADRGVQIIGIALDDPAPVAAFVTEYAINFPILMGDDSTSDLSRRLGNQHGGLPFTVITDRQGEIVTSHTGELVETKLRQLLDKLTSAPDNSSVDSKAVQP